MYKLLFIFFIALTIVSCQNGVEKNQEKSIEEIKSEGRITNADLIRNPVSANEPQDTVNIAKLTFVEATYDFGEVKEGDVVKHTFQFTNTGKVPLLISNARSTCGCTVPEWPKEPIAPGAKGEINVEFNTKNKKNQQSKPVTITANTFPATTKVFLKGYVKPAEGEETTEE
ncbi:MAG: hypothetical protein DHS20C18_16460 [Saprospiraceae bacterium]|nr:MAG: hypothetical protein DHS20C18_16460 [Saprospiraceae bacterium]